MKVLVVKVSIQPNILDNSLSIKELVLLLS